MAQKRFKEELYNSYDYTLQERFYEEFEDWYKELNDEYEEGDKIPSEDSQEFYDRASSWDSIEWEDTIDWLYKKTNGDKVVVLGSCGTWQGRREIVPTIVENIQTAIYKCCRDCDYIKITQNCSAIEVVSAHHDGTNHFTIKVLNDKGCNTEKGDLSNRRYHKTLNFSLHY